VALEKVLPPEKHKNPILSPDNQQCCTGLRLRVSFCTDTALSSLTGAFASAQLDFGDSPI
jgi:hypothetical protein